MESLRLLQIRTLRQVFSSRSTILRQSFRQISRSSQQPFRTRPSTTLHTFRAPPSSTNPSIFRSAAFRSRFRATRRRFQSTQPSAEASEQNLTLSQRLKKLSREYGWSAVGVYLLLSVLDFPFCFLAVRLVGVDKIGHWEHVILSYIRAMVKWPVSGNEQEAWPLKEAEKDEEKRVLEDHEAYIVEDHGYAVAEKANAGENASIWTQLALAYAIHKSFIFIRVPLTAAVTPKVVRTLRSWGWNIGKIPTRKKTAVIGSGKTGINTKGTGVKPD